MLFHQARFPHLSTISSSPRIPQPLAFGPSLKEKLKKTNPFEEFYVEGKSKEHYSADERIIMDLEKKAAELRLSVENERKELPAKLASAREQGYKEGFSTGEAAGREKTAKEYERTIDTLQQKVRDFCGALDHAKKTVFANAHSVLLAFCFEFAKKIIHTEVSAQPDIILPVLKKALSYIADRERLVIKVAKDDWESASGRKDFWIPVGEKLGSVVVEPDERVEKGGCIIESNSGVVDARLGVQIEELKDVVCKAWESIGIEGEGLPSHPEKTIGDTP